MLIGITPCDTGVLVIIQSPSGGPYAVAGWAGPMSGDLLFDQRTQA